MDAMASAEEETNIPGGCDPFFRQTMCIGNKVEVLRPTDPGFREEVSQQLGSAESWMLEKTVQLKQRLRNVTTYDFWQLLMEGMSEITGSQYAFVAKRVLYDDEDAAVEMPHIGEPGSCLMGLAFYFNDHKGQSGLYRDYKYQVYGCPCQWMRHDRVVLIPDGLTSLTPNNPNAQGFPIPAEGYLAVPLIHKGKCFAHFGCLWTADGLKERPKLGWGMLEMFLHALEDQVAARVLEGLSLGSKASKSNVIPQNLVTGGMAVKHSLRPYARRLSHELRTPMQGVVGMLDVMYASVVEATNPDCWRWPDLEHLKKVIEDLRSNIEVAQDSSKRAVDAADNMVHAYDFNMEVPSTPSQSKGIAEMTDLDEQPCLFGTPFDGYNSVAKDDDSHRRNFKRRRSSANSGRETPNKIPHIEPPDSPIPMVVEPGCQTAPRLPFTAFGSVTPQHSGDAGGRMDGATDYFSRAIAPGQGVPGTPGLFYDAVGKVVLNSRLLKLRELLHEAVHDSLRTGGRPDSTKISGTPHGERLNVEVAEAHSGEEERKQVEIEVIVDENVPESMIIDGSYLMKMISAVFHNAFKFTPSGRITLNATVNASRQIIFSIVDTGEGIPNDFIPDLFKPFATEDESLTRHRDGLGLGLYVAKGIARKMGGDLWLEHTATEGQNRGSEFRIRLPITPTDASGSTPGTPAPPTPGPLPDTTSLRPDTASTPRPRSSSPLTKSVVAPPPVRRKLAFDSDLAKKLPLRILVVEDNRINRALLCNMLKKLGYRDIEEARDGVEAVEMFKAALQSSPSGSRKRVFDLVLMDLWMPRMDGYEAAERIVQLHKERRMNGGDSDELDSGITVLAVSADATEEARAKAALKGIHGFVGKPFGIADLGKAVMDFRGKETLRERRLSALDIPTTVR